MKEIELTQGYTAIVDDEDYERVLQYNWSFSEGHATCYDCQVQDGTFLRLCRFVLGATDPKQKVTFVNRDRLDNRKSNLKIMTHSEVIQRGAPPKNRGKTSQYKGVGRKRHKWEARIGYQGQQCRLGYFETEEEAAHAYDTAAKELFGTLAYLNFPNQPLERIAHSKLPIRSGLRKWKGRATSSQFKGVYRREYGWAAQIKINGERIWSPAKSEMEAARIYDEWILKHLGSNARSNFQSIWAWKRRQNENVKSEAK